MTSRRAWIDDFLRPWCRAARERDLRLAEDEWGDVAGRADPHATLWTWAWSRFPELVVERLPGVNETHEVVVTLRDGTRAIGYPDGRRSRQGRLTLVGGDGDLGPWSIDEIVSVERIAG